MHLAINSLGVITRKLLNGKPGHLKETGVLPNAAVIKRRKKLSSYLENVAEVVVFVDGCQVVEDRLKLVVFHALPGHDKLWEE